MKAAIVNSSYPNLMTCISALRFTGSCQDCNRVLKCQLPEGKKGLVKYRERCVERAEARVEEQKRMAEKAKTRLREAEEDARAK